MKFAFFDAKPYEIPHFEKHAEGTGIEFSYITSRLNTETVKLAEGFEGVCVFANDTLSATVIDKLWEYGVKIVALRCTGFNNVDMKHAFGKIRVLRIPAYSPHAIAEHAAAMLLTSVRRIHKAYNRTKELNFNLDGLCGTGLYGKTAGIVGTGKIGLAFFDICRGFGMRTLACDKFKSEELLSRGRVRYASLDELLSESDIVSLHCPLKEESYHMINESALSLCKDGVIIINTSRSGLIDAEALADAVERKKVGGVCLDIYEEEAEQFSENRSTRVTGNAAFSRLISMPEVIVTAHQAYLTDESLDEIAKTTVKNITELRESGKSKNELC